MQHETCTSSLARCVVDMALAHATRHGSLSPDVHLVTQARKWSEEARPSLSFRLQLLGAARAALEPHFMKRSLKRRKTDTSSQLAELEAELPRAPALPQKLAEYLTEVAAPAAARGPFLRAVGHDFYDAARAKLPPARKISRKPEKTFENSGPPGLALAAICVKSKLLVAPSMLVNGASGLYAARSFAKGELICHGSSLRDGWEDAETLPESPATTLQISSRHILPKQRGARAARRRPCPQHLDGDEQHGGVAWRFRRGA